TWCGPCKMMTAKVFPDAKVGDYFNENFINAKIDMESGEGPALALKYGVRAYPTYLFVNGDGEVEHRALGFIPVEKLLEVGATATSMNSLGAQARRFDAGERDPEFLQAYIEQLNNAMDQQKGAEVTAAYLATLDDLKSPVAVSMIAAQPGALGSKTFGQFVSEPELYMAELGSASTYMSILQNTFIPAYMQEKGERLLPTPEQMQPYYQKHAPKLADRLGKHFTMVLAQQNNDLDTYAKAAVAYYEAYPTDNAMELNSVAWNFYETVDDPAMLKKAIGWAKQSVALEKMYANMDTLAWLYEKSGQHKMAVKTATEAIELAKADGEDYTDTERILHLPAEGRK
ncbi:MAG: thioredoxin fold domain-containing protein, partial [Saprospiraceae bacterium]